MPVRQLTSDNEDDRIKLLSKLDLLSFLGKDEIETLSKRLIRKEYPKGSDIVKVNENGNSMFVLLEGLLNVYISNENGQRIRVAQITPGNYFGEMSLLTGERRSATVTTATDSIVFEVTRDSFNHLISLRNDIVEKISDNIAARRDVNEKLLSNSKNDKDQVVMEFKQKLIKSIKSVFRLK
jgi:CRP-like cAMP-binding protein